MDRASNWYEMTNTIRIAALGLALVGCYSSAPDCSLSGAYLTEQCISECLDPPEAAGLEEYCTLLKPTTGLPVVPTPWSLFVPNLPAQPAGFSCLYDFYCLAALSVACSSDQDNAMVRGLTQCLETSGQTDVGCELDAGLSPSCDVAVNGPSFIGFFCAQGPICPPFDGGPFFDSSFCFNTGAAACSTDSDVRAMAAAAECEYNVDGLPLFYDAGTVPSDCLLDAGASAGCYAALFGDGGGGPCLP